MELLGNLGGFLFFVLFVVVLILWLTAKDDTKEEKNHKLTVWLSSLIIFIFLFFGFGSGSELIQKIIYGN